VAEAHRARIEPHGIPGDGCHGDVDVRPDFCSVRAKLNCSQPKTRPIFAEFRIWTACYPRRNALPTAPEHASVLSDSDTHTMADVKTADVAGALFTNQ
jgi:hypothetical protein